MKYLYILCLFLSAKTFSQTLVSISIIETNPTIGLGSTLQFKAIGIYSNNTTQDISTTVVWVSSQPLAASISNGIGSTGVVTAHSIGTTTISATYLSITGTTNLTIVSDADGDGVPDNIDNCIFLANIQQLDNDSDGLGNDCDCNVNISNPTDIYCTSVKIYAFPSSNITPGNTISFYTALKAGRINIYNATPNFQWLKNSLPVGTNSPTYSDNNFVDGDVVQCVITSGVNCVVGNTQSSNSITLINPFLIGNVGIGVTTPITKLDVEGGIRTKYSGSFVTSSLTSNVGVTLSITIPALPNGWDFKNTVVLVSNADGAYGTVQQAKLTSLTNIDVYYLPAANGTVRLNWIVFKM